VNNQETIVVLMSKKSDRAYASAKALLAMGDTDGACNRAYYAMLDAARAALLHTGCIPNLEVVKTHSGLINAVSNHFVKTGLIPKETGRLFKHAEELRSIADYNGESIDLVDIQELLQQTEAFVEAMRSMEPGEFEKIDVPSETCKDCNSKPCVCEDVRLSGTRPRG
jgi:uncharacterized protein (UPF0332 family)